MKVDNNRMTDHFPWGQCHHLVDGIDGIFCFQTDFSVFKSRAYVFSGMRKPLLSLDFLFSLFLFLFSRLNPCPVSLFCVSASEVKEYR